MNLFSLNSTIARALGKLNEVEKELEDIRLELNAVTGQVKAAKYERGREMGPLNEERLQKNKEVKSVDAELEKGMAECGRMEYAIRALDNEKSKKNDQMKSVDDELAERKMDCNRLQCDTSA